jgi:hypothetical protein
MALQNVERAAQNVGKSARLFNSTRFEIHGDDHVGAEQQRAFHGNWRRQESVNQSPPIMLDRHEKSGVST